MAGPPAPLPSLKVPAPRATDSPPLVIVLPGRYDDLQDLQRLGIAAAIQQGWPQADVLLVGATPPYYRDGKLAARLHDEIVVPARLRGYRRVWLAGASMGGLGALLYERAYPGDVTGLILFAPYMGDSALIRHIAAAGGAARWQPPQPAPPAATADNYPVEIWRVVHAWNRTPARAHQVWLACGDHDDLLPAARLIAAQLPPDHFLLLDGGHAWTVWDRAAQKIAARLAAPQP
ncbi:MAG TPA: alpha/beta hydrolase [Gammaproteobacteria bacterium]|nr:alpha/beta hydrolase [Gammaproteobacteria bacterium]